MEPFGTAAKYPALLLPPPPLGATLAPGIGGGGLREGRWGSNISRPRPLGLSTDELSGVDDATPGCRPEDPERNSPARSPASSGATAVLCTPSRPGCYAVKTGDGGGPLVVITT